MIEFSYIIGDENGMHARPAGKLAALAKQFSANVTVKANGKEADGKRLLSLMTLGAAKGVSLHFSILGEDESAAADAIRHFCEETLLGEIT